MIESAAGAREKLKLLAGARASRGLFLTATLSTSRLDDWRQLAPTFLNSEFNRLVKERGVPKEEKRLLQGDLDYVLDVLKYDLTPKTEGLALFVDGEGDFYERIELPFRLVNRLFIEPAPHIRPLVHAIALLEPFVLARVSRDESKLYLVDEWGIAHEDDLTGPRLRSSDRETGEMSIKEYYAAARQDTLVDQHYKEVGAALSKLLDASGVRRVVLSAQHEIASAFRRTLPAAVSDKIVTEMPYDAAATVGKLLAGAREAVETARHQEMMTLASRIKEGLGSGGRGVSGFDDVLGALGRHQVQTLLVDRNYRPPGWLCLECFWVGLVKVTHCPVCGGEAVPVADAVGELVRLAILQNSRVEVGENIPVLEELGGVAGILRYA
jgi:Bacterial archaeo-eukaryotic release factor family 10